MKGVLRIEAFHKLALVITIHKELNVFGERLYSSGEASRLASQTFQIMAQICIDGFDRVSFLFIVSHFIRSAIIQSVVPWEGVTEILLGLGSAF